MEHWCNYNGRISVGYHRAMLKEVQSTVAEKKPELKPELRQEKKIIHPMCKLKKWIQSILNRIQNSIL
jgi:hypothetical protein